MEVLAKQEHCHRGLGASGRGLARPRVLNPASVAASTGRWAEGNEVWLEIHIQTPIR